RHPQKRNAGVEPVEVGDRGRAEEGPCRGPGQWTDWLFRIPRHSPTSPHPLHRKPVLPVRLHHGITVHDADATLKGWLRPPRDGSLREEKLMKRPLMVMPSVLLGLALVIAGCGGTSTSGTNPSSKVSVTPPTSLIKS